jgi:glycosyltransferase involved in cell wall biosynthesis
VALVHHWLTSAGGAEKVLYELHQMYPKAPIYTAAYIPEKFPEFAQADIRTTFLDKIPYLKRKHQLFPLFMGIPFKTLDLSDYDLVISSCAAEAKYVRTPDSTLHICYCHTPVRYYWSDYDWFMGDIRRFPFGALNPIARPVFSLLVRALRKIDYAAAQQVSLFIANSRHIQKRIRTYYHRESVVIYPPIQTNVLKQVVAEKGDYYLIVGRQVASKRLDIAVEAFNELGLPLKVAGAGEQIERWRPIAKPNIEFLGRVSDQDRNQLFAGAKGFVFPPEEDFGMTPVEALAAGTPVLAFNGGGAPEYVRDGQTGMLFSEQSAASLVAAVRRFEGMTFDVAVLRQEAARFDIATFRSALAAFVDESWQKFELSGRSAAKLRAAEAAQRVQEPK